MVRVIAFIDISQDSRLAHEKTDDFDIETSANVFEGNINEGLLLDCIRGGHFFLNLKM
jgi:hypothetical protein